MRIPGLSKKDVEDLERTIPNRDVIAEKQGTRSHHGSIEAAEEAYVPWLRARRRAQRRAQQR